MGNFNGTVLLRDGYTGGGERRDRRFYQCGEVGAKIFGETAAF